MSSPSDPPYPTLNPASDVAAAPEQVLPLPHSKPIAYAASSRGNFVPLAGRTRTVFLLTYLQIGVVLLWCVQDFVDPDLSKLKSMSPGNQFAISSLLLASVVCWIVWLIKVLRWQYIAHANLRALGFPAYYSPGWAIGSWFVPVVNFLTPYLALRELYHGSAPGATIRSGAQAIYVDYGERTPIWFSTMWLVGVAPWILVLVSPVAIGLGTQTLVTSLSVLHSALMVVGLLLFLQVVDSVLERQAASRVPQVPSN